MKVSAQKELWKRNGLIMYHLQTQRLNFMLITVTVILKQIVYN
jgi:hypothetical protein